MKKILISGCSKGLGYAMAQRFVEEGNSVMGFSRSLSNDVIELQKKYPENFKFVRADISRIQDVEMVIRQAVAFMGEINVLVNNAGVANDSILAVMKDSDIESSLNVNLKGSIFLTKNVVREMLLGKGGCVLSISSIVAVRGVKGLSVYSATKAALDAITRSLARELGSRNIRVNSICPGYVKTDMSKKLTESQLKQIISRTPLGRLGNPDDICKLASFLISDDASFITGQSIVIDGGLSC